MERWLDELAAAQTPAARRNALVIAGLWLTIFATIPLRYYLGSDPSDERFAWRMFSAVRVQQCRVGASERVHGEERSLDLFTFVHTAWVTALERNREGAVQKLLALRCHEPGTEEVRLVRRCASAAGRAEPSIVYARDCASGTTKVEAQ